MIETGVAERSAWGRIVIGAAACVFVLALLLSWSAQRRLDAWLDGLDARTIDASSKVLDQLLARQSQQLASTVALLSEDARVRAMVLTPSFDRATVVDLLTDLKATSGASVVALLDSDGTVRAVVGAPEMDQLDLGTSSLIRAAIDKPSAQLWAFADEIGVLSASAVRLDHRVRALFMMGFGLEDALLQHIEKTLGATGAVFVGERMVASASQDAAVERDLRSALELPVGKHSVIGDRFLAARTPLSDSPVAASVAWLLPRYRHADAMTLTRALSWLPAILVGVVLALFVALAMSRERAGPTVPTASTARRTP